jgi:hypothetical protein
MNFTFKLQIPRELYIFGYSDTVFLVPKAGTNNLKIQKDRTAIITHEISACKAKPNA